MNIPRCEIVHYCAMFGYHYTNTHCMINLQCLFPKPSKIHLKISVNIGGGPDDVSANVIALDPNS